MALKQRNLIEPASSPQALQEALIRIEE